MLFLNNQAKTDDFYFALWEFIMSYINDYVVTNDVITSKMIINNFLIVIIHMNSSTAENSQVIAYAYEMQARFQTVYFTNVQEM